MHQIEAYFYSCGERCGLEVREHGDWICARVGIFFNEVVGGCSCGDDPLSVNAYCQIQVSIDRASAEAEFAVIAE